MGMTIEERIAQLVRVKHYASPSHYETLDVAIDTMRKYQKIEEIVGNYGFDTSWLCLRKIREVLENGDEKDN